MTDAQIMSGLCQSSSAFAASQGSQQRFWPDFWWMPLLCACSHRQGTTCLKVNSTGCYNFAKKASQFQRLTRDGSSTSKVLRHVLSPRQYKEIPSYCQVKDALNQQLLLALNTSHPVPRKQDYQNRMRMAWHVQSGSFRGALQENIASTKLPMLKPDFDHVQYYQSPW